MNAFKNQLLYKQINQQYVFQREMERGPEEKLKIQTTNIFWGGVKHGFFCMLNFCFNRCLSCFNFLDFCFISVKYRDANPEEQFGFCLRHWSPAVVDLP